MRAVPMNVNRVCISPDQKKALEMEGMVIIDGRNGAGLRHCHWCGQGSFLASSRARVAIAGMMVQFLASVGQLTALLQPQSFYSQPNAWSPVDARRGRCAIYAQLQRLERCSLIDLSEVGRFTPVNGFRSEGISYSGHRSARRSPR
jgi:hypothetical protein